MAPSPKHIDSAARRLAHTALFPAFAGGTYVFCDELLRTGTWLPAGHPFAHLGRCAVSIPRFAGEAFELLEARCRILIEDALSAATRTG
jgi:hypothetical protein